MPPKLPPKGTEVIDLTGPSAIFTTSRSHQHQQQQPRSALQPHLVARKLVVKNLRPAAASSPVDTYYARVYADLDNALDAIFNDRLVSQPMERLYRGVEDICLKGDAADLADRLRRRCEEWLSSGRMLGGLFAEWRNGMGTGQVPSTDFMDDATGDMLLHQVLKRWKEWSRVVLVVRGLYSYLDRSYLMLQGGGEGGKGKQGINEMAISIFKKAVFGSSSKPSALPDHAQALLKAVSRQVNYSRTNDPRADDSVLRESITLLRICGVYGRLFEPAFLADSHAYFERFATEISAVCGLKDYITAVARLLDRETARCDSFNFESTTKRQLLADAHRTLVEQYADKLLDGGSVSKLLADQDVESMRALYDMLKLSGLQKRLKVPWERYIREAGAAIVGDVDRADEMVVRLLQLRRALDVVIRDAFFRDDTFSFALREAFSHFINDQQGGAASSWGTGTSRVGELIAKHIDMLLRGGLKTLPKELLSDVRDRAEAERSGVASTADEDAELDRQLDQALELFRFVDGKDVFEAFYKRDLARRLLLGRSASQDAERSMLTKLKVECGASFTHNLEQMFKDQELAKEEMASYRDWLAGTGRADEGRGHEIDLTVNILSAAAWPTFPEVRVQLPREVLDPINRFDAYYKSKHTGRRLTWMHNMAHCVLRARFDRGVKELLVSAPQAAVLMLFNEVEPDDENSNDPAAGVLTCEQISQATGLQGAELERTLQSLACGKARVLTKHPKSRDVKWSDTFRVNRGFTDPRFRVKINQIQLRETRDENRATHQRVAADRQFETQAAIVRIMKSRKTMTHAQLVAEVINQTKKRGAVDAAEIKANIDK
jgi:cullin-4